MSKLARHGNRGIGSGEFVVEGSRIFAQQCESCHGREAEGNAERGVPRLAGQHYSYLVRQMHDAVDGRRPALPALHSQRIEPLDYEQVRAVSDFLARIGWEVSSAAPSSSRPSFRALRSCMPAVMSSDVQSGLSAAEARSRLEREGFNELPAAGKRSAAKIAGEVVREPMFALLIAAAIIYAVLGERGEALMLLAFATISVSIAIVQQGRSEKALHALRELTSPRALVIRDGQRIRIPGREVVRGDVVVIAEGDRVPADGVLVAGDHIEVDESLLTGESHAVRKRATTEVPDRLAPPGGENVSQVFSGTLVLRGTGLAIILATGSNSAIGAIGQSLAGLTQEQPRLQRETRRLVIAFGAIGLALCVLAFGLYWWLRGSWLEALLGAIALGMSLLPEEFPLVLTVFMVMGAWRLSRSRVLTRRAAAIESLGAATVLCTDKTGTLTRNLMSVAHLQTPVETWEPDMSPQSHRCIRAAVAIAGGRDAGERRTAARSHGPVARQPA